MSGEARGVKLCWYASKVVWNTKVFYNTRVLVSTNSFLEINSVPTSFQYFLKDLLSKYLEFIFKLFFLLLAKLKVL